MAPKNEAAGCVLVESVGQRRRPRQAKAQLVEGVFKARAALRPAMDGDAGGLVDDQHQPVAVEQARKEVHGGLIAATRARRRYFTAGAVFPSETAPPMNSPS